VFASVPGAYPGTGQKCAILDGGVAYGPLFEASLGALCRARGWLDDPPAAGVLAALVSYAHFGGLLVPDGEPTVERSSVEGAAALSLRLVRHRLPAGGRELVHVRLAGGQPDTITIESPPRTGPPAPTPIDHVAGLLRAVAAAAGNGSTELLGLVRKFPEPSSAREYAALAAAAVSLHPLISATAMLRLGDTEPAAHAIRDALAILGPELRASVLAVAADTHGPAFAARLR
jgi:hypothetical protein